MLYIQNRTERSFSLASSKVFTNCPLSCVKCLSNPELVQQVFGLFQDYLLSQLDVKGKQIKTKQKIDKETIELKLKGNHKQFKLNADLDNIFD